MQLVSKDSLSEDQKEAVLEIAMINREDVLQQNTFSPYDYYSPLSKTVGMMKCIILFKSGNMISWSIIANSLISLSMSSSK